jgi:hypothetical protein
MSSPALIFGMASVYHAFLAATNSVIDASPTPAQRAFWSTWSWGEVAISVVGSIIVAIAIPLAIIGHKRGLRPTFEAIKSFFRLYWVLSSIRMSRFNRSREDYKKCRKGGKTIGGYVSTATSSLKIVSFSLITGIQYEELSKALEALVQREQPVTVDISLLDPRKNELTRAIAPAYDASAHAFSSDIHTALDNLFRLKNSLRADARNRLRIHIHKAIPFGSAILIDHDDEKRGRIQIETKGYKSGLNLSWGFELRAGGSHALYKTLVQAYTQLIEDGEELQESLSHPSK